MAWTNLLWYNLMIPIVSISRKKIEKEKHPLCCLSGPERKKKYSHLKILRQINLQVNTVFSRNFCQNSVREKVRNVIITNWAEEITGFFRKNSVKLTIYKRTVSSIDLTENICVVVNFLFFRKISTQWSGRMNKNNFKNFSSNCASCLFRRRWTV